MVSLLVGIAILFVIIFVGVVIYFVVFRKYPGLGNLTQPSGEGDKCYYDADCPINSNGIALRCVNSQVAYGTVPAVQGTCTAYCGIAQDCWNGNTGPQSPTCVSNNQAQQFCTLAPCSSSNPCGTGEACIPISQSGSSYCVVLGNSEKTSTYISQSIPCESSCFGFTGSNPPITCLRTGGNPQWNNTCTYNTDCGASGIPCSTGCYASASSYNPQTTCPTLENKSTGAQGVCGVELGSSSWPASGTGYCVQTCSTTSPCDGGLTCTNGVCVDSS